jgi:hypothetical protein
MIISTGIRHPQMQFQHFSWKVRAVATKNSESG